MQTIIDDEASVYTLLNTFTVSPERQSAVVESLRAFTEEFARNQPGFVPIRWAKRVWALPFLTALCHSARYAPYATKGRRHKSLVERARGLIGQAVRWLPGRALTVVADSGYAAIELLAWCQRLCSR